MTDPWPGVIPGARPEVDALAQFKRALGGAELEESLQRIRTPVPGSQPSPYQLVPGKLPGAVGPTEGWDPYGRKIRVWWPGHPRH